jgi:pilus biogenesis lipoprotein CpaD
MARFPFAKAASLRLRTLAAAGSLAAAGLSIGGCIPPEMGQTEQPPDLYISDQVVVSRDLSFAAGSTALTPTADAQIDALLRQTDPGRVSRVTVIGYGPLGRSRANGVARALRHGGIDSVDVAQVAGAEDTVTVAMSSVVALPTSCLVRSDMRPVDGYPYLPPARCANDYNLARMVADPDDLDRGRAPGPASGAVYGDAVQRYRTGAILEFEEIGTSGE